MHKYRNNEKAIKYGELGWQAASDAGLLNLKVELLGNNLLRDQNGHEFINMVSCSYLGLDVDPRILQGSVDAVERSKTLIIGSSRLRLRVKILDEAEDALSNLYNAPVLTNISCGITSCGVLPLIASGHITGDNEPITMVFDKHAHFTMHVAKPICADEGTVLTCDHNNLEQLEEICKTHKRVAYVCDGIYSMGDKAPLKELLVLQEKYGMFLYIDDSHGLSVYGDSGEGYAKAFIGELNPLTMVVASMWKGLGARGSVLMFGAEDKREMMKRYGGGLAWSQYLTSSDCGAILASVEIHKTPELKERQEKLQSNIALLDSLLPNSQSGSDFPIRLLQFGEEKLVVSKSKKVFEGGFYASPVCFPVVARGQAGLRIMIRSDLEETDICRFSGLVKEVLEEG